MEVINVEDIRESAARVCEAAHENANGIREATTPDELIAAIIAVINHAHYNFGLKQSLDIYVMTLRERLLIE